MARHAYRIAAHIKSGVWVFDKLTGEPVRVMNAEEQHMVMELAMVCKGGKP